MDYEAQDTGHGVTATHIQRSGHDPEYGVARFEDPAGRSYWTPIRFVQGEVRKYGGPTGYEDVEDAWEALNVRFDVDWNEAMTTRDRAQIREARDG